MGRSGSDISDYHINNTEIQSLSSREAICVFFSHMGYNTEARITQTPANIGITATGITRQTRHIERIADQEDYLQIYLFEVDSVTIALTRYLSRIFRDFRGHFLLVITSDYERIDFVLVETYIPAGNGEAAYLSTRKLAVRPRILTVERRKPTRVQLRVLNRFPYTESDPYAQYDKLLSAYSVADWSEEFFNNRALFSDYYLKERLRDTNEWKEYPRPVYDALQKIFSGDGSVVPVLKCLGFNTVRVDREKKVEEPNYRLYVQDDDSKPVTVALTYPWSRSLDGPDETRDADTPDENPGKVVVSILEKGETDWAIVTNGKIWRLYSRKTHSRATNYYEIDLEEVLAETSRYDSPGESFRYFWLLFRAKAFQPFETVHEGEKRTSTFLDTLLEGSRDYAKELGERLKERVFNEIFPHFAAGFIQYIRDTEGAEADLSRERLDIIFHGTLALLYRLLFLFYAESRDLLPVKEVRGYYEKSLRKLTQEISDAARNIQDEAQRRLKKAYSVDSTELYERLTELFHVIDEGDARINVPCYNGSLFMTDPGDEYTSEAENARFLMKHKIPDHHLALGLDLMARDLDDKLLSLVFIDYKSLGVRQLGSIYEGLLEFKLEIADGKLGIIKGKGREVYVPFRELSKTQQDRVERQGQVIKKGQVYLSNDKRERKATGSYYTPDYIVKYIVENTVGPVLEEKFDKMRPGFRDAEKNYRNAVRRQDAFRKRGMSGSDPEKVANTYRPVVNELFDLSILDPAMGSGHFLVEAVDFVTDKMITFLNAFPWNPVVSMLRKTRETILESMNKQEITIDTNRLTDVNLLKRHVLKRCVYGVDLNPMAVELAKVSLWLDCFTLGAPLSFLDHHLKCGNSLIGSRIETVRKEVESDLFGTQFAGLITATAGLIHVGELSDVTVTQVKESTQAFRDASFVLEPFKEVLDFWTAQYFCGDSEASEIRNVFLSGRFPQIKRGWYNELDSARPLALRSSDVTSDKHFFHWELEFPEVFFGSRSGTTRAIAEKENPGFDAVIGNPPYVSSKNEDFYSDAKGFIDSNFNAAFYQVDLYYLFMEQAYNLAKSLWSLIVPDPWLASVKTQDFRRWLVKENTIGRFAMPRYPVFEADVDCLVLVCKHMEHSERKGLVETLAPNGKIVSSYSTILPIDGSEFFLAEDSHIASIVQRIQDVSIPLTSICTTGRGIGAYHHSKHPKEIIKARAFHAKFQKDDTYQPELRGEHIYPHRIGWGGSNWLSYGDWLSEPRDPVFFKGDRILCRKILSDRLYCAYTSESWLSDQQIYIACQFKGNYKASFVCAIIASHLIGFYARKFYHEEGLFPHLRVEQFRQLPIRRIFFTTPKVKREHQVSILEALYEDNDYNSISRRIDDALPNDADGKFPASEYSTSVKDAIAGGYITKQDATGSSLKNGSTSGYDESGNSLEKTDVVHDFLACLAQKMTDMSKFAQSEQNRLLGWMEDQLHVLPDKKGNIGIEALSNKTKIKNYVGDYQKGEDAADFADILKILQNNKSKIRANLSDAAFVRNLEREYEKSLETLLPIKDRLAKTDRLIDQIVYKLYGLTEEEIAIVEGRKR